MTALLLTFWSFLSPDQTPLAPLQPESGFQQAYNNGSVLQWSPPQRGELTWDSGPGTKTGVIRSGIFRLPAKIHFFTAGCPTRPGLRIYLQEEGTKKILELRQHRDTIMECMEHVWSIPSDWRGATVRLVAEDTATGPADWFVLTPPVAGGEPWFYSVARAASRTAMLVWFVVLFLLPGLVTAIALSRKDTLSFTQFVTALLCGSGIAGYAVFWIYLANASAGKYCSFGLAAVCAVVIWLRRQAIFRFPAWREAAACIGLALTLAIFYNALGFLYLTGDGAGAQAQVRFIVGQMPPDNVLPLLLSDRLYHNRSARNPSLLGDWRSSDRPPLQAGAALFVFPFSILSPDLTYQLFSVFLQCFWVVGLWALIRSAGLDNRYLLPVLGFAIFSFVGLFHSFYVWPKMLSAGYLLLAMAPAFRRTWSMLDVLLSATAMTLALLSHTSVAFVMIPFALYVVYTRRLPRWQTLAFGFLICLALYLPWRWYQAFYDPPGDALLKFNMTYAQDAKLWKLPFTKLLVDSYSRMTPAAFWQIKMSDVRTLFIGNEFQGFRFDNWPKFFEDFGVANFFHVFFSLGLLNLGFACRYFARASKPVAFADHCLAIAGGSMLVCIFVLYPPGATVIHQWSLAGMLLLILVLAIYLVESFPKLVYPLLAVQAFCIFPIYVFSKPMTVDSSTTIWDGPLDPGMALVALIAGGGMIYAAWRAKLQEIL